MIYHSQHSIYRYLMAVKEQLDSITSFGIERFTGIVIGRFFSITHHCGHEMNRRITNEKHHAIGFVTKEGDGTKVRCIRLAGMTNPLSLIGIFLFYEFLLLIMDGSELAFSTTALIAGIIVTVFVSLLTALTHSLTERGQEGSRILTAFLIDPVDFYSLL